MTTSPPIRQPRRRVPPRVEDVQTLGPRGHEILPHTADVGLVARAGDLAGLFEEAAAAFSELTADITENVPSGGSATESVTLCAHDLTGLAFSWLNELVTAGELRRSAVTGAGVESVDVAAEGAGARLVATIRLAPFDGVAVMRRTSVKSATFYRLSVRRSESGWRMTAYLDV
ncbi:MAG: archease [Candidatus Limnocylindrales bacterium]